MKLVWNWKRVLKHAWSIRLIVLAGVLSGAEIALPLIREAVDVPAGVFAGLSFAATAGAGCRWKVGERSSVGLESVYLIGFTSRTSTQIMPFRVTFGRSL